MKSVIAMQKIIIAQISIGQFTGLTNAICGTGDQGPVSKGFDFDWTFDVFGKVSQQSAQYNHQCYVAG